MRADPLVGPSRAEIADIHEPIDGPEDVPLDLAYVWARGSDPADYRGQPPMASHSRALGHELGGQRDGAMAETEQALADWSADPGAINKILIGIKA